MADDKLKLLLAAQRRLKSLKLVEAFDPHNLKARPTKAQAKFFRDILTMKHRYVLGGNQSGKTASGAWEASHVFNDTHPFWKRHPSWGNKPLTMMIIGRTSKQYNNIWEDKMKPFMKEGSYRERRTAGILDSITHLENGNKILFFSHNNAEDARQKVQHFVAEYVWLDEMPNSYNFIEELHRRCQSRVGSRFIATFTPKIINEKIRKMVDTATTYHKKYTFKMLDNPIFKGREDEILAPMLTMPESYRKTVLEGDWYAGDSAVYHLRPAIDIVGPTDYHPGWRHVESVDPAARGLVGLVLLAEDPRTNVWYIVQTHYLKGAAATVLLNKLRAKTEGYNIVRRISDPHEGWFMDEASIQGRPYWGVESKNNRKKELINQLQEALLAEKLKIAPWCTELIDEFNSCQWSETVADRIVGASRFHLLDAVQYGIDRLPKVELIPEAFTFDQKLKQADQKRRLNKAKAAKVAGNKSRLGKKGKIWARKSFQGTRRSSNVNI